MARNPGTEAEAASAALRTGSGVTPSPASVPGGAPAPLAKTGATQNSSATPASVPPPIVKTGITPSGAPPKVVKTGLTQNSAATSPRTPPPPARSGRTNPGSNLTPPLLPTGGGLHAAASTPGPMVQQFVTLGRYQLLSRLAVGGMAEVYLARQGELSGFKTLVVVKKVLPHLAEKPDFIAMFLDEARIASMLDHPNIVRITEVGRTDSGEYFLAMELVQGKPLASILQQSEKAKTPIPHNLGALIVANAAAGLHHAHQLTDTSGNLLGLVHRDISPQNIMVSFEGSVKVIDFGIARALGRLGDTNAGSLKGKLGYMAPEQARGESIDARADLFSLGVVLWECVAGRRLFLRENDLATLRAVVYEPIPSPSKFVEVDPALDAIIRRAVARSADERFQTAEEMRIALEKWVFSSGGASTHDLAAMMKSWFPKDRLQWQRAARLALDMQESDPPIDVAFPNLAANKTGHSRTGAGRIEGSGAGAKIRSETSNRAGRSPVGPAPILEVPDLRPKLLRRLAILIVIVLSLAAGGAAIFYVMSQKPKVELAPETQSITPVRPMVETLPVVEGAAGKGAPAPHGADHPSPQAREQAREQEREMGSAVEENTSGKKKNRSSSAEKRAILRQDTEAESAPIKHLNPSDDKPTVKKNKDPRPNPF